MGPVQRYFKFVTRSCVNTKETETFEGKEYPLFKLDTSSESHLSTLARKSRWTTWRSAGALPANCFARPQRSNSPHPPKGSPDRAAFCFPIFLAAVRLLPCPPQDSTQPRHRQPKPHRHCPAGLLLLCLAAVPGFYRATRGKARTSPRRPALLELAQAQPPSGTLCWAAWRQKPMGCCPIGWGAGNPMGALQGSPRYGGTAPFFRMLVLTLIATWYGVYYPGLKPGGATRGVCFWRRGPAYRLCPAPWPTEGCWPAGLPGAGLAVARSHQLPGATVLHHAGVLRICRARFHTQPLPWRWPPGWPGYPGGCPAPAAMLGLGGAWLVWRSASVTLPTSADGSQQL